MKVVIIGTGNAAHMLGRRITFAPNKAVQVVGRNKEELKSLAVVTNAESMTTDLKKLNKTADVYVIAVSDGAIAEVASQINVGNKIVVHTAASVPMNVLEKCSENYGVIYPLQTLRKEALLMPVINVLIDANNGETKVKIREFAESWARQINEANDEQRLKTHVAAVVVNNFVNHLLALTEQYCKKEGIDFKQLQPLIEQTTMMTRTYSPAQVQTGPARRNDTITIDKHLGMLANHPKLKGIYEVLNSSITEFYKERI